MRRIEEVDQEISEALCGRGLSKKELSQRIRREAPQWWCRLEATRIRDLLATHVSLALESGTDPECVAQFLDRVRELVLNPNGGER